MTEKELKEKFEIASEQYDNRVAKLKILAVLNPPATVIKHSLCAIKNAVNDLILYGGTYERLKQKEPDYHINKMLNAAVQNAEIDEYEKENETLIESIQDRLSTTHSDLFNIDKSVIKSLLIHFVKECKELGAMI